MKWRISDDKRGQIKSELLAGGCDPASADMVVANIVDIIEFKKPLAKLGRKPISNMALADLLMEIEKAVQRDPRLTSDSSLAKALYVNRKKIRRAKHSRVAASFVWGRNNFRLLVFLGAKKRFRRVGPDIKRVSPEAMMRVFQEHFLYLLWDQ